MKKIVLILLIFTFKVYSGIDCKFEINSHYADVISNVKITLEHNSSKDIFQGSDLYKTFTIQKGKYKLELSYLYKNQNHNVTHGFEVLGLENILISKLISEKMTVTLFLFGTY